MHSFWRSFRGKMMHFGSSKFNAQSVGIELYDKVPNFGTTTNFLRQLTSYSKHTASTQPLKYHSWDSILVGHKLHVHGELKPSHNGTLQTGIIGTRSFFRCMTTAGHPEASLEEDSSVASLEIAQPQRIKFKRMDKTAKHIMNILDKEAVDKVRAAREIPDIRPGYIVQLKVEVPENKRRVSVIKGIIIARRNAGLNTTFRLRRLVAGIGVESVFPLYSPNIKEMKVLDKKKVRRAKLYYLRDRMNALKK